MTTRAFHCSCAKPLGPSGCTCMQSQQPGQASPNLTFHGSFGQPVPNFSPHSFPPHISQPFYPHEPYGHHVEVAHNHLYNTLHHSVYHPPPHI
ncbi:hypothetical protein BJV78DRAFT_1246595, partial [Lactifluus subvellereus]